MLRRLHHAVLPLLLLSFAGAADLPPYGLDPYVDIPLIGAGLGLQYHSGMALRETRATPIDLASLDRDDLHPMDRWAAGFYSPFLSSTSGAIAFGNFLAPFALGGLELYRGQAGWGGMITDFILLEEALTISAAFVSYSKAFFKLHPTPLVYGSEASEEAKMESRNVSSFFSGHTTAAFTAAVFTGYTYGLKHPGSAAVPWVWGGSLATAAAVGGLRIAAGKHFPSDILAGAAVGSLFGYLVPRLHLRRAPRVAGGGSEKKAERKVDLDLTLTGIAGVSTPVPTLLVHF
jgi:membrane-associated phospholipid phosphatase